MSWDYVVQVAPEVEGMSFLGTARAAAKIRKPWTEPGLSSHFLDLLGMVSDSDAKEDCEKSNGIIGMAISNGYVSRPGLRWLVSETCNLRLSCFGQTIA